MEFSKLAPYDHGVFHITIPIYDHVDFPFGHHLDDAYGGAYVSRSS